MQGTPRGLRYLGLVLGVLGAVGCACAGGGNGDGPPDIPPALDGATPYDIDGGVNSLPTTDSCGTLGNECCPGNSCDVGLLCDLDKVCRSRPGGAVCMNEDDCAGGFVCDPMSSGCRVPDGMPCFGSADCLEGRICDSFTETCAPAAEDCTTGKGCCEGSVCQAGATCSGGACVPCGGIGDPCCDGFDGCESDDAVCLSGTCETPTDCGQPGQPCCPPDSGCVRGVICGDDGTCEGDTGCGSAGGRCCSGGLCGGGLLCDPIRAGLCIAVGAAILTWGFDCGEPGERCCLFSLESGVDFFTCEGTSECQWYGFCGDECPTSTGEKCDPNRKPKACCGGDACRPSGAKGNTCCRPQKFACNTDADCCGQMVCQSEAERTGSRRTTGTRWSTRKLANGGTETFRESLEVDAQNFKTCQCVPDGLGCMTADDCCSEGAACRRADGAGPGEPTVCVPGPASGECVPMDGACGPDVAEQCCAPLDCQGGKCVSVDTGCVTVGSTCDVAMGSPDCCNPIDLECQPALGGGRTCCGRPGTTCTTADDCCGGMSCSEDNECTQIPLNGDCVGGVGTACAGGAACLACAGSMVNLYFIAASGQAGTCRDRGLVNSACTP